MKKINSCAIDPTQYGTSRRLTVELPNDLDEYGIPRTIEFFGLSEKAYKEMLPYALKDPKTKDEKAE